MYLHRFKHSTRGIEIRLSVAVYCYYQSHPTCAILILRIDQETFFIAEVHDEQYGFRNAGDDNPYRAID